MSEELPPTNYRQNRRKQEHRLLILVLAVLVVGGTTLIGLIWGPADALLGGLCLLAGGVLIGGIWLLLTLLQKWVDE